MKKVSYRWVFTGFCIIFSIAFNALSWMSRAFSDLYTDNVFPVITSGYGRLTSLFPFSVGEIMLIILVILIFFFLLYLMGAIYFFITKKKMAGVIERLGRFYYHVFTVLFPVVLVIMTLNCFVLYHCTPIKALDNSEGYTVEDLAMLRDYIVTKCNELSLTMERDEEGYVIYNEDMGKEAGEAMRRLYDGKNRLGGFYVTPKALTFSGFMSQQNMMGYYFPFSMEANYNDEMYIMNKPFTMCHELAHTHGYIYEDEANFLGYLGCISSDDPVFVYSGYLGVLNYVNNDYYKAVGKEEYASHVRISDLVKKDDQFLTEEAWKKVEQNAVLDTKTVKKAADTFIDTNLKVNGISSGKVSYTHVVSLLLDYYSEGDRYEK